MRRMMPRPRWYRDVRVSRRRRDWHVGVSRPRRERDSIEWQYRDETEMFKKTPPDRLETEMFETETTTLIRGTFISLAEITFEIVTLS